MGQSKCDKCGEMVDDIDAGFSPGRLGMGHDCGGSWQAVVPGTVEPEASAQAGSIVATACLARPSDCLPDVPGALDLEVSVTDLDWTCTGEVTMVPVAPSRSVRMTAHTYVPYGIAPDTWVSHRLLTEMRANLTGPQLDKALRVLAVAASRVAERAATEAES